MRKRIYSKINRNFDNLQTSFFIRTEPTTRDNLTRGATNTVGRGFSPRREHDPSLIFIAGRVRSFFPALCHDTRLLFADFAPSRLSRAGFTADMDLHHSPKNLILICIILRCLLTFACCFPALPHPSDVIGGQDFSPSAGRLYGTHGKKYNDPTPEMGVGSSIYLIN